MSTGEKMTQEMKIIIIKFIVILILSPLIGYLALQIVINIEKAKKASGMKKWQALALVGFLIAVLLGWTQ